jgi:hypothetical protein
VSFYNVKRIGDSASADHVAGNKCPERFRMIIDEKDRLSQQDFILDDTSQFWKKDYHVPFYPRTKIFLQGIKSPQR